MTLSRVCNECFEQSNQPATGNHSSVFYTTVFLHLYLKGELKTAAPVVIKIAGSGKTGHLQFRIRLHKMYAFAFLMGASVSGLFVLIHPGWFALFPGLAGTTLVLISTHRAARRSLKQLEQTIFSKLLQGT